ncbi:MAG: hypothetical protein AAFY60_17780 [Myxococcota bacterium]
MTLKPILPFVSLVSCALLSCTTLRNYELLQSYEPTLMDASSRDTTDTKVTAATDSRGRQALILSAFFGLDDGLPGFSDLAICAGAGGMDGMPVIFSHELDVRTLQAGDFKVTTASGAEHVPHCVTLAPADDPGELRTALLVGHYGSFDDPPMRVEVVGNLLSIDREVNFRGLHAEPTTLEEGPSMVLAERLSGNERKLGESGSKLPFGSGTGCPEGTKEVVRVTWAGGVTKPGGDEVDDIERQQYRVTIIGQQGARSDVTPFALGDLVDGDNNHELCLNAEGTPVSVYFPAGYLTDPRDDANPESTIEIREW